MKYLPLEAGVLAEPLEVRAEEVDPIRPPHRILDDEWN